MLLRNVDFPGKDCFKKLTVPGIVVGGCVFSSFEYIGEGFDIRVA